MIVATFPGCVVPRQIFMALKFGMGFLGGLKLCAWELGGGGVRTTEIFDFGSFLGGKILASIFWGSLI